MKWGEVLGINLQSSLWCRIMTKKSLVCSTLSYSRPLNLIYYFVGRILMAGFGVRHLRLVFAVSLALEPPVLSFVALVMYNLAPRPDC